MERSRETGRSSHAAEGSREVPGLEPGAARLLTLQQSAGNAAVARLLQRQEVTFDLEVPSPEEAERLRRQGVQLPSVSAAAADPRGHSDYVDRRLTAVGYSIYIGGYVLYLEDVAEPLFVPESHFDFTATNAAPADLVIHSSWDEAINVVPHGPHRPGDQIPYAYYRGARGVIAPTLFTPATTPRVINTALQARRELAEYVQEQMVILAISIVGGMALRAIVRRLANIGRGPRAPTRPPREIGEELIKKHGGSVRKALGDLNKMRLPQDAAAEAVEAMFKASGRSVANRVRMPDGNLVLTSVRPGMHQPVNVVTPQGQVHFGRATLTVTNNPQAPMSVSNLVLD